MMLMEFICFYLISVCSGLVAASLGTPADVIKTRIMNNPDLYKGTIDCIQKSVSFILGIFTFSLSYPLNKLDTFYNQDSLLIRMYFSMPPINIKRL